MKCKRKKVLIHSLQVKYSIYLAIAMITIMILTILNTYVDTISTINKILPDRGESYILFWDLVTPLLLVKMVLMSIIIVLLGILVSHRIAGPIYRFATLFEKIGRGELDIGEIKLRQKDEFHDEAEELSSMIKGLRDVISNIKEDVNILSSKDDLTFPKAKEIVARVKEKLSFFKV